MNSKKPISADNASAFYSLLSAGFKNYGVAKNVVKSSTFAVALLTIVISCVRMAKRGSVEK